MSKSKSRFAVALLVTMLAACGSAPGKESTGEVIDDSVITTKIKAAIVRDSTVNAIDVKVDTFKGQVQLSGFVDSQVEIERAKQIASKVAGVKSVRNDIRLKTANK